MLNGLIAKFFPVPSRDAVSTADRIESARITSTKLKALKPKVNPTSKECAIDRLLTKAARLYKEFKEQKTPPSASKLLERLDQF